MDVQTQQQAAYFLSIDDLESLLHLATLNAPALPVGDQRDVWVLGHAVITCAAVNTLSIVIIAQVVIATTEAFDLIYYKYPVIHFVCMPALGHNTLNPGQQNRSVIQYV